MKNYKETDIRFYSKDLKTEGDFISEDGDFSITEDYESARQDMTNRIRTQKTDWRSHPNIGGDLELLEGEPNTRKTGDRGVSQIYETLTYDNRFNAEDLHVRAVPTSIDRIEFFTLLDNDSDKPIVVAAPLEL